MDIRTIDDGLAVFHSFSIQEYFESSLSMKLASIFFLIVTTPSLTSALDQPQGIARKASHKYDRELFWFGGQSECSRQVQTCQNANNIFPPPFDGWLDMLNGSVVYLGSLDGNPDISLLDDLIQSIMNLASFNLYHIGDALLELEAALPDLAHDATQAALEFLRSTPSLVMQAYNSLAPNVEPAIQIAIDALGNYAQSQIAPILSDTIVPTIMSMLNLMQTLSYQVAADNLNVLSAAAGEATSFLATLANTLPRLMLPRYTDEQAALGSCSVDLLQCKYEAMVIEVMPGVIGATLTFRIHISRRSHSL